MIDTSFSQERRFRTIRKPYMAEKVVFVDGQEGCGKTMFSRLISAFDRVEKLTFGYEIEQFCALRYLNNLDIDSAAAMVRLITDLILYDMMMSRKVNCRPSDLSSIFKDANTFRYIKRLFMKGDIVIPERIKREKPILSLTVHKLLSIAEPVFEALKERVVFIEIVRHPLYMIIQQAWNNENLINDVRDFVVYYKHNMKEYPWYAAGWEDLFDEANPVEKAIYYIEKVGILTEKSKLNLINKYNVKMLTIPFEKFVIEPWPYMEQIRCILETRITKATYKMMKKQNIPRKMYAEGIPLEVYKRCGWKAPNSKATEKDEFQHRMNFAARQASTEVMKVLNRLCAEYEEKYMGGRIINANGRYE